jgi:hypothetical protein
MDSHTAPSLAFYQRYAWLAHFAIISLVALSMLFILFTGVDANDFQGSTGVDWAAFKSSEPDIARYLERLEGLLGAVGFGHAAFGVLISFFGFRQGDRFAWYSMWLMPGTYALVAMVMLNFGSSIGYYYAGLAAFQTLIQVAAYRRFFPQAG